MGFFFYITDFWFWRWKMIFSLIRLRLDKYVLRSYYINFFFFTYSFSPIWDAVESVIEIE